VTLAYVGVGSNLEQPESHVRRALDELHKIRATQRRAQSSLYRSAPVGYSAQPDFVNAVASVETGLSAEGLLAELQAIEDRHARERSFANAPRTLDLDLLLFGAARVRTPGLVVPHPRMHERAFVLQPLVEIAPDVEIPGCGLARALLARCNDQRIERLP
jgi:2-amino-4-hydroxy-6-hydroxymethyldihydropteridine diphosphokinase